jgi:hypothetical protein
MMKTMLGWSAACTVAASEAAAVINRMIARAESMGHPDSSFWGEHPRGGTGTHRECPCYKRALAPVEGSRRDQRKPADAWLDTMGRGNWNRNVQTDRCAP